MVGKKRNRLTDPMSRSNLLGNMKLTIENRDEAIHMLRALMEYVAAGNPQSQKSVEEQGGREKSPAFGAPSETAPLILQVIKEAGRPMSGGEIADALSDRFPKENRKALYSKLYSASAYMVKKGRLIKNDEGKFKLP